MINCHFHDARSSDGAEPLERHCRSAAGAGIRHVTVTNHAEVLGADGSWQADLDEMRDRFLDVHESVLACRREFPDLSVRLGIELEYRPEWTDRFDRLTRDLPFDFVLGSVHMVDGHNVSGGPGKDSFFEGRPMEAAYARYFRELDAMLDWGGFDVVSHFDLVKRFGHRHYGDYDPQSFGEQIRGTLSTMADRGIGIEINTSGVFGPGSPYPERPILEWAREAGVPALTIGTDSHDPDVFAHGLVEGIQLARDAGWNELTVYESREPSVRVPVEEALEWARSRASGSVPREET
ncbi:MAG: histidinol-phosphatase HisJ family protein [marine benthic group bacterium]|nr:histidinol-phosphatase HisJ family protein [Candidatus Benthicola marisminoris]